MREATVGILIQVRRRDVELLRYIAENSSPVSSGRHELRLRYFRSGPADGSMPGLRTGVKPAKGEAHGLLVATVNADCGVSPGSVEPRVAVPLKLPFATCQFSVKSKLFLRSRYSIETRLPSKVRLAKPL
jgi:hypothetical protein